jgi:hypothetical protein
MVETAKVDIRKLQLLNDRINQCLDALNQVRLSVHGLSHTGAVGAINPLGTIGQFAGADPRFVTQGINPLASQAGIGGIGNVGFGTVGIGQPFGAGGLSHTGAYAQPFAQPFAQSFGQPFGQPFAQAWNPLLQQQAAAAQFAPYGGLSHTSAESLEGYGRPAWADPMLQVRVAQTFPYAQYAVPPMVSLY